MPELNKTVTQTYLYCPSILKIQQHLRKRAREDVIKTLNLFSSCFGLVHRNKLGILV